MVRDRALVLALSLTTLHCLPPDNRPPPGELRMEVRRSDDVIDGFETTDGWTITFDRFVTALGVSGLGSRRDDGCSDYSFTTYDRLYDFAVADTSGLALHYGLGQCTLRYGMGSPTERAVLMDGATVLDRTFMIDPRSGDLTFDDDDDLERGIGLWAVGRAERNGVVKRFEWRLRQRHAIRRCFVPGTDGEVLRVGLDSGAVETRYAEVRARELFRLQPSLEAPVVFGLYAAADDIGDGDGTITLEELAAVELDDPDVTDRIAELPYIAELADDLGISVEGLFNPEAVVDTIVAALADELPDEVDPRDLAALLAANGVDLRFYLENLLFPRVSGFEGAGECQFVAEGFFDVLD